MIVLIQLGCMRGRQNDAKARKVRQIFVNGHFCAFRRECLQTSAVELRFIVFSLCKRVSTVLFLKLVGCIPSVV